MAFTRQFIRNLAKESGVELPSEMENALVSEHLSARNAYAEEQVKAASETSASKVEDTEEYKTLKKQFEDYRAEITAKEGRAAKEAAYRALLQEAGIDQKRIDTVIRAERATFDNLKLDKEGKFENADELTKAVKTDWADFMAPATTTTTTGAPTATPPASTGGKSAMTKAEIMKITDRTERRKAIAEHMDLFQKG